MSEREPLIEIDWNSIVQDAVVRYYNNMYQGRYQGKVFVKEDVAFIQYDDLVKAVAAMKVKGKELVCDASTCGNVIRNMREAEKKKIKDEKGMEPPYLTKSAIVKIVEGLVRASNFREKDTDKPIVDIQQQSNLFKDRTSMMGLVKRSKFLSGGGTFKAGQRLRAELTRRVKLASAPKK
jgi:hypothetical protein